jgi:tetratricopeptide (TPR) repeat protein
MIAVIAVMFLALVAIPPQAASTSQQSSSTWSKSASAPQSASFEQLSQAAASARTGNRDDDAIRLYQQALKLRPEWDEGLWYAGTLLYQKERYADARDALRHFVAESPDNGPGWAVLGMSEFQTREYSRSLDHLRRAMALGVGDRKGLKESVFYFVAILLTRFEQFEDSMGLLYGMRSAGQSESLLLEPAGLAALRLPLLPAEIPPDRREMVRTAGAGAFALGDQRSGEAEKLFSKMVEAYPQEPGVHYLYGVLLLQSRPEDGIREIKRELEISPSHIPAKLRLAEQYMKATQLEQALPMIEQALKLDPGNASAHMVFGEALVAKGDLEGAIRELETARQQEPQAARIRWDLVRAYSAAGRSEDAYREKEAIQKLKLGDLR